MISSEVAVVGCGDWASTIAELTAENTDKDSDCFKKDVQLWVSEEQVALPVRSESWKEYGESLCEDTKQFFTSSGPQNSDTIMPWRSEVLLQPRQSYVSRSEMLLHTNDEESTIMAQVSTLRISRIDGPSVDDCNSEPQLLIQPETRPISHEELVAEVKGIYAGLLLVEAKCIDVDKNQSPWILHDKETNRNPLQSISNNLMHKVLKIKRGLASFVNGTRLSVIADTGATQNIVSAAYAKERKMTMKETSYSFKLGNSAVVKSMGTVMIDYAFAEEPSYIYKLVCHVLPHCTYDLILGHTFLFATESLSKHRRRLTECLFSVVNVFHLSFLGNESQLLEGVIADRYTTYALPDTGAERNVMDLKYAVQQCLYISREPHERGYLQFADGTYQETVGRVYTHWKFKSGDRIPITFEVLEDCCYHVIIGEDILWDYDVFQVHEASLCSVFHMNEIDRLAPFGYEGRLESLFSGNKAKEKTANAQPTAMEAIAAERERRRQWNYQYGFDGAKATTEERKAEEARQKNYKTKFQQPQHTLVPSTSTIGTTIPHPGGRQPLNQGPPAVYAQTANTPHRDRNKLHKNPDRPSRAMGQR